jgi:hypothetical protein
MKALRFFVDSLFVLALTSCGYLNLDVLSKASTKNASDSQTNNPSVLQNIKITSTVPEPITKNSVPWQTTAEWQYRMGIIIDLTLQPQPLSNVPILIRLTPVTFDYSKATTNGADIRFFAADNMPLSYQILQWDPNGESLIWVKINNLRQESSCCSVFYLYYGNNTAVSESASIWDTGFVGIYSFHQNSFFDLSPSANDLVNNGTTTGTGVIGVGRTLSDPIQKYLTLNSIANDLTNRFSMSMWFKVAPLQTSNLTLVSTTSSTNVSKINLGFDGGSLTSKTSLIKRINDRFLTDDKWHQLVFTYDNGSITVHVDGEKHATWNETLTLQPTDKWFIGIENDATGSLVKPFIGSIDELWISSEVWSGEYINLMFRNFSEKSLTFQSTETYGRHSLSQLTFSLDAPANMDIPISIDGTDILVHGTGVSNQPITLTIPAGQTSAHLEFQLKPNPNTQILDVIQIGFQTLTQGVELLTPSTTVGIFKPPPTPAISVTLSSDLYGNISASRTVTPDFKINISSSIQSVLQQIEARVVHHATKTPVSSWNRVTPSETIKILNLNLQNNEIYGFEFRGLFTNGRYFELLSQTNHWKVEEIVSPYDGLGLPEVTSLSDASLTSTIINGNIYTRSNPFAGKTLTLGGTVGWNTAGPPAIFLRSDKLVLTPGTYIHANGLASSTNAGAAGGSGGGEGNNGACTGTEGGAGGGNGATAMGGKGWLSSVDFSAGYNFGFGGHSANAHKAGGNGVGAGGVGGGGCGGIGRGGGGGGGLIVITANQIEGTALISASGGHGDLDLIAMANGEGGGGGGGVIWMAFKSYNANILPLVKGGWGQSENGGFSGRVRIFQIHSDNSLIERSFLETWTQDSVATKVYSSDGLPFPPALPPTSTLSNQTLGTGFINGFTSNMWSPLSARQLTINGNITYAPGAPSAIFLRAENLILNPGSKISANGTDAYSPSFLRNGGTGGSGGGSGTAGGGCATIEGGTGGSGTHGGTSSWIGAGGIGWAKYYNPVNFSFGFGGDGGNGYLSANKGVGASGAGGGGGGGGRIACSGGSGGGGGGGLVVIVARSIAGPVLIEVKGGNGTSVDAPSMGGSGGGGVVWIATATYDGQITTDVSGGTGGNEAGGSGSARIFQILNNGSLVQRNFSESW